MNIVVLAHRVPFPANKGEKIRTFNQVKSLASLGHKIHLFAPYDSEEELLNFAALKDTCCKSTWPFRLSSKYRRLLSGFLFNKPLSVANFYDNSLQKGFDKFLVEYQVDAILCTASSMAEYVFNSQVLNKTQRKPILIMDFMDVDSDKWGQYQKNSRFPMSWIYAREQQLVSQFERQTAEYFDKCYLIAQAEVSLFKDKVFDCNNVDVLGNGLDTKSFYPSVNKKQNPQPVLLFTGVMDYKPNVDAVLWFVEHCWQAILVHFPQAKFVIAGMNPVKDVSALAQVQGIEVTGFVEDILPYYQAADIFIAPFRLARGVQNKVLQAFSCALPVVSTPMGAEGINCIPETNILIAAEPKEFVQQVCRLASNHELARQIGIDALQLIEHDYSWEGQLAPLISFLNAQEDVNESDC